MVHIVEIRGSDLEGYWFVCVCGAEGSLYPDDQAPAEMEGSTHLLVETYTVRGGT